MSDLATRTISGAVFLAILLSALLWRAEAFGAVFLFIIIVMMHEYLTISMGDRHRTARLLAILTGSALFAASFAVTGCGISAKWLAVVPLIIILIPFTLLIDGERKEYACTPYLFSSILYIAVPFSMTCLVTFPEGGTGSFDASPLLAILILIWCSDIGAYLTGLSLGRKFSRKLCPEISPKKTWVGYWGGLVMALAGGYVISATGLVGYGTLHTMILALIVDLTGTFGDLAESQFKRHFGVKDSGRIMPGHGGLLDRFDGALLAFPAAVSYILLTNI